VLFARAFGSAEKVTRVEVGGSALIVARGQYRIDDSLSASNGRLVAAGGET
jgi:hypothetical protein